MDFKILSEIITVSMRYAARLVGSFCCSSNKLWGRARAFSTCCPQKMWKIQKICHVVLVLFILSGLFTLCACSQGKGVERFKALPTGTTLVAKSEEEVKKRLGEPDVVSKTPDDRILWVYKPSWKVIPSPKDTLYVEFENGKVGRVFQIK